MNPRRAMPRTRRPGSRGVTLVELMIAVTIGLLLVVVLAQLFLGSRQTFATTDDVSRMQDNIRYTQQLLARTIHLSGYKSQPNSVTSTIFSGAAPLDATIPADPKDPNQITVRFQGSGSGTSAANCQAVPPCTGADGKVLDCLGVAIDAGIIAENTFSIAEKSPADGNSLYCSNRPNGANPVEIVSNVKSMKILFGDDTDGDLVANRYVGPGTVSNINNVVSLRIALLFETPTASSKAIADNQRYDMIGDCPNGVGPCTVYLGPYNDRRIRRLVTTTINLRNRTP